MIDRICKLSLILFALVGILIWWIRNDVLEAIITEAERW